MRSVPVQMLLVGCGGFVGAVLRFLLSSWTHRISGVEQFPVGTLAVNVTGCLAIGLIAGLAETRDFLHPEARLVIVVGLLGGFTTYSAFAYDTLALAQCQEMERVEGQGIDYNSMDTCSMAYYLNGHVQKAAEMQDAVKQAGGTSSTYTARLRRYEEMAKRTKVDGKGDGGR